MASESRDRWQAASTGWGEQADAMTRAAMPVSLALIEAITPQPGHDVLELAAGPGDTGFMAAELIRPGGTLICSDIAPGMLTVAQERAKAQGVTNVRFRQIDAQRPIDQPAGSLDGVICRWGYMLMADPEAALRETRRILKPGAAVALAAWTPARENLWAVIPGAALERRGLVEPADTSGPGQFAWGDPARITAALEAAGFDQIEVTQVDFAMAWESVEHYWAAQTALSSRIREALPDVDDATLREVKAEIADEVREFTGPDGSLRIPAASHVGVATA